MERCGDGTRGAGLLGRIAAMRTMPPGRAMPLAAQRLPRVRRSGTARPDLSRDGSAMPRPDPATAARQRRSSPQRVRRSGLGRLRSTRTSACLPCRRRPRRHRTRRPATTAVNSTQTDDAPRLQKEGGASDIAKVRRARSATPRLMARSLLRSEAHRGARTSGCP